MMAIVEYLVVIIDITAVDPDGHIQETASDAHLVLSKHLLKPWLE